jgi:hypothetical protein
MVGNTQLVLQGDVRELVSSEMLGTRENGTHRSSVER